MRKQFLIVLFVLISVPVFSYAPMGRSFGFGLVFGDPLGGTMKFWLSGNTAIAVSIGADVFGAPRIGADYLWHFNAFRSSVVNLYAGPGVALGFGYGGDYILYRVGHDTWIYRPGGGPGVAVRGILGIDVDPTNTPIEMFLELGPMLGLVPAYGMRFDAALGIRFYP